MIDTIRTMQVPSLSRRSMLSGMAMLLPLLLAAPSIAQAPARLIGSITTITGHTLTVKPDAGDARTVDVPDSATIKRISPGEHDLSKADLLPFSGLAVGDRVLIKLDVSAATPQAIQIIAIKQEDVAQKQQRDRDEWQKHGVAGLVKSVDPAAGVVTISTGFNGSTRILTIQVAKSTVVKRYAPASISYESAKVASLDAVHVGDQLRARGAKSADGATVQAEEIVSGTFHNISGIISAIDPATSTITLKDLATKKQVTLQISAEAQMHRLPEMMAQMIAAKLNGGGSHAMPGAAAHNAPGGGAADPQQMLSRLPTLQLADLKKGDAIMAVTTEGADKFTAITLLAGVQALLEAPAAQDLLANWSVGGGEAAQ